MSLGSFVQGAFQGYQFGENAKDRKADRKRNEERFEWERGDQEWLGETRGRQRDDWSFVDEQRDQTRGQWARESRERAEREALEAELDQIRNDGFEEWQGGQSGQPVPQNTPQGNVRVPLGASGGTGEATPAPAQATFPGLNVPGLSQPNANAAPFRYGDDVPRMENRPIRVPLGSAGDDTLSGNMGGDMLLTDIQPVRGTYSEEEQSTAPRKPRSPNAMDPSYRAPVFSELAAPAASRRAPTGPVNPETIEAETGGETIREAGAVTYGGGAQPRPTAPGMPVDPRTPAGPEAGQPQRQASRNARTVLGDNPRTELASLPADTQEETGTLEAPQTPDRSTGTAVRDVDPTASAFVQDVQGLMRKGDISAAQRRIVQGLSTGEYGAASSPIARAAGAVGDYFTASPEEGQQNAAERRKVAAAIDWYNSDEARALFEQNPDALTAAATDPIAFLDQQAGISPAAGQPQAAPQPGMGSASSAEPPRQPGQPQGAPAPAPQGSGAGQPVYGGMTASQAAQFQDLPEPRMAIEDGGQPISIARDSLASNANADNNGQAPQVTDQQRAQGAATFREYYQTQVVPRQIEALYRNGEIEAAEQLQTWFEDERSQGLQENYARAVHAASIGDERGFFDHLGKVYNSFDDGYRFIADESDLYKNDAGATMAKITLENTQTGERFTQEYEGGEELIQQVLTQMDPISIFEQLKGQAEAEAAAQAEQQAWEIGLVRKRIEAGVETGEDRSVVAKDVMMELMKNPGFAQKSPEEQAIEMEGFMRLYDMASRGTASPQAPVYLGD
jgi:hypothetical protein